MVLIVAPIRWRTTTAASSDKGIDTTATNALRQLDRNKPMIKTTKMAPVMIASVRLEIESSTYDASR